MSSPEINQAPSKTQPENRTYVSCTYGGDIWYTEEYDDRSTAVEVAGAYLLLGRYQHVVVVTE